MRRPVRPPAPATAPTGVLLGLVAVAQFLVSSEVFAATGILLAVGLVALAVAHPRTAVERLGRALPGVGAAVLVGRALLAYAVWLEAVGPRRLDGSVHGAYPFLAALVVPTVHRVLAPARLVAVSNRFILGATADNGSYLGIPLLVLLVAVVVWQRRRALVLLAASSPWWPRCWPSGRTSPSTPTPPASPCP